MITYGDLKKIAEYLGIKLFIDKDFYYEIGVNNLANRKGQSMYSYTWFGTFEKEELKEDTEVFFLFRYSSLTDKRYKGLSEDMKADLEIKKLLSKIAEKETVEKSYEVHKRLSEPTEPTEPKKEVKSIEELNTKTVVISNNLNHVDIKNIHVYSMNIGFLVIEKYENSFLFGFSESDNIDYYNLDLAVYNGKGKTFKTVFTDIWKNSGYILTGNECKVIEEMKSENNPVCESESLAECNNTKAMIEDVKSNLNSVLSNLNSSIETILNKMEQADNFSEKRKLQKDYLLMIAYQDKINICINTLK